MILQIKASNPVKSISGYEPTTDYWDDILTMTNTLLEIEADKKTTRLGADSIIKRAIPAPVTAVEWAEFVMAINHMLWLVYEAPEKDKMVDIVLSVLNDLYYYWHDKALDTLKGDDLSTYLRITD